LPRSAAKRQKATVPQARQDEPLGDQHRDLNLGLIAWPPNPGWQQRSATMRSRLLVGAVDAGLVAASGGYAGPQVVAD